MAIEIRGLAPLLQVYDMPSSIRFYRDLLGFEVVTTSPVLESGSFHWALLSLNGVELMLNTAYEDHRPSVPDRARVNAHGDTGLFFAYTNAACANVDAVWEHLRARGLELARPKIAPYGMKQLYVRDPDGYALCFQWPAK